jgi:hypothetical protein
VRIDFCDHDVLDVFDEWRRATGITTGGAESTTADGAEHPTRGPSLPAHLERVVLRLSSARATGSVGTAFDDVIDRVAGELEMARAEPHGIRGDLRQALLARLSALDRELLQIARRALDDTTRARFAREADEELAAFRLSMAADVFARAREAAIDNLVRERFGLPTIAFS